MSDYCECCTSNTEHIRQHYDPDGLTMPGETPEQVLKIFRECCDEGDECELDLADVEEYFREMRDAD